MKFRVVILRKFEAIQFVVNLLKDYDVIVYDVREADIVATKSGEKQGEVYILCCEGSTYNYLRVKKNLYTTEIEYEGFRTLM